MNHLVASYLRTFIIAIFALISTSSLVSAQSSGTWTPSGWNYNAPPNIYATDRGSWLYTAAPVSQVDLTTSQWGSLNSLGGWVYYEWPFFYSQSSGHWHYNAEDPDQWAYDFGRGQWNTLGTSSSTQSTSGSKLGSSTLYHQQTWKQWGNNITVNRDAMVRVPSGKSGRLPVLISLHGSGGTPDKFIMNWEYLTDVIHVVPRGYETSWNVLGDSSAAPDVDFVRNLIYQLRGYSNVDSSRITVLGYSNGSDLVNRLLIEAEGDLFQTAISVASPLTSTQYHDGSFWSDTSGNHSFDQRFTPARGRKIITITGTDDEFIPYYGGDLYGFYFYPAETGIYYWATAMGYSGSQKSSSSRFDSDTQRFSYLNGQVEHYKVTGADHGMNVRDIGGVSLRAVVKSVLGF